MWKGKPIGDGTPLESERAINNALRVNSRSFRLVFFYERAIGRAAKVLDFQSGKVGSTPTWHSRVWTNWLSQLSLKQLDGGSNPPARAATVLY